jgi:hypothetical protein
MLSEILSEARPLGSPAMSQVVEGELIADILPPSPPSFGGNPVSASESRDFGNPEQAATIFPERIPEKLTRRQGPMTRKRKRRSSVVEIGTGPAKVKIYTVNRKDGYPMFSLYWKEGGQRR